MNLRKQFRGVSFVRCRGDDIIRLMNICGHRNIVIWDEQKGDDSGFYIYTSDSERLLAAADKCSVNVSLEEKNSLRLMFMRNKRRLSLVVGIALFAAAVYIQSLYIWHVEVHGCESYTEDEILDMLELTYPCYGKLKKSIDTSKLRDILTDSFDEICWASCSMSGTKLTIDLKESVDVFTDIGVDEPCNIVASADCTIYSMVTSSGTALAEVGDDVKKGDILISGAVNICNDDSEVVDTVYVPAGGEVYGVTKLDYSDSVTLTHYVKTVTDEKISGITVSLFGFHFSPYNKSEGRGDYDTETDEKTIHIKDMYFPASFSVSRRRYYEAESALYTNEEATDMVNSALVRYIDDLEQKGVQILQKNVIIASGDDCVTAEGTLTVKLPIGVPDLIDMDAISQEEDIE